MASIWRKLSSQWQAAGPWLLEYQPWRAVRLFSLIWFGGLYLLGIYTFGNFFDWSNHTLEYHDWASVTAPRLQFLRTAIRSGQLPMHISDPSTFHGDTIRYFAVPDVLASPQMILLYRLSIQRFSLVNVWLLYSLGFAGLLVLRRRLRLSAISFAVVFLLFNFNGHILAHYSVGHTTWGGYFLFPWFAWLVFRLLDGDHSWKWTFGMAGLLFFIWLQGSFHQYVWLLLLLGFIAICIPRTFWYVVRAGVFTLLMSAFRILPAILLMGSYSASLQSGYPSLYALLSYLFNLPNQVNGPFFIQGLGPGVGEWELTAYVGILGGVFLLYFGFYRGLLHRHAPYRALLLPLGLLLFFSMGFTFNLFRALPIPILQGERVPSRMFSVVLVFGLILGAERLQRWLEQVRAEKTLLVSGSFLSLGLIGFELWQSLTIWRISNGPQDFWIEFNMTKWYVKNQPGDTIYYALVFGGLAITLLSMLVLAFLSWRESRRKRASTSVKGSEPG